MKAAYFCYERSNVGRWVPVVYFDDKPLAHSSNGQIVKRSELITIPLDDELFYFYIVGSELEPIWSALQAAYPPPVELEVTSDDTTD